MPPGGGKWWRLKHRAGGTENRLSLGVYPGVPLKLARERCDVARKRIADGVDPAEERKAARAEEKQAAVLAGNTFESVTRDWLGKQTLADATRGKALWMFESLTFPWIGARPVAEIKPPEMLAVLRRIESRG